MIGRGDGSRRQDASRIDPSSRHLYTPVRPFGTSRSGAWDSDGPNGEVVCGECHRKDRVAEQNRE